jgi:hypothetical protein
MCSAVKLAFARENSLSPFFVLSVDSKLHGPLLESAVVPFVCKINGKHRRFSLCAGEENESF